MDLNMQQTKVEHIDDIPIIEKIDLMTGDEWEINTEVDKILFITKGIVTINLADIRSLTIDQAKIILLTSNSVCNFVVKQDTSITILRFINKAEHFEYLSINQLINTIDINKAHVKDNSDYIVKEDNCQGQLLDMKNSILLYIENLDARIDDGLTSPEFFNIKIRELFLLFKAYYNKDQLLSFFRPLMCQDIEFTHIVMSNYKKIKTVKELADITNYSVSGFEKKFRKVFKKSAGAWLKNQKAAIILSEISAGEKPFKIICAEHGFSSPAYFNNYCKSNFGLTPGEIRRNKKKA